MRRVYQTEKQWEFHEDGVPENIEWVAFDDIKFIPITDRVHAQLCIPSHNGKFGIYTLDTCKFFGAPASTVTRQRKHYRMMRFFFPTE